MEKDNRREEEKKKEEEDLIGDVNVVATCCTGVCSNHAFLLFFLSVFVPVEFLFSGRNGRYTPVQPVLSGIGRYLERYILKVFRYQFIDRYEEFQPYQPVRYGTVSTSLLESYKAYCKLLASQHYQRIAH